MAQRFTVIYPEQKMGTDLFISVISDSVVVLFGETK